MTPIKNSSQRLTSLCTVCIARTSSNIMVNVHSNTSTFLMTIPANCQYLQSISPIELEAPKWKFCKSNFVDYLKKTINSTMAISLLMQEEAKNHIRIYLKGIHDNRPISK